MTQQAIATWLAQQKGTYVENLRALVVFLSAIVVPGEYHAPRCACGAHLTVTAGARTGRWCVAHPRHTMRRCPRDGYKVWGKAEADFQATLRKYLADAPDVTALEYVPDAADEEVDDTPFNP
jgi:hypothetical protein